MLFSVFDVQARRVFKLFCGFCLVALLFLSGCGSSSDSGTTLLPPTPGDVVSTAALTLSPDVEVPPVRVPSSASGSAVVTLNQTSRTLSVQGSFTNLTTPLLPIADFGPGHIHIAQPEAGQSFVQATGPVIFVLNMLPDPGNRSGRFQLETSLTSEQVSSFLAGAYYINIHTEANPPGELRAQVVFPL
ncbi:MAG: CHRD domain-containing protein [Thermostichus sp. DG02_5_bins_236]